MRRFFKYTFRILISLTGCILLYLLFAFSLSKIEMNSNWKEGNDVTMYLLSNGVHTDVVVPVKTDFIDWSKFVHYDNTNGKDTTLQWVAFGWGDKGFYLQTPTWADLKFSVAFNAVTGLSSSAMHVTYHHRLKENEKCVQVKISSKEYQRLIDYIKSGFAKTSSGEVIHIATNANYGANDAFYEGTGRYHLFHSCNTWTNNALKTAGMKCSVWTPFSSGVMNWYLNPS